MSVDIRTVKDKRSFRHFVHFAELVPNGRLNWVPPIWTDERVLFSETKNPACKVARTEKWLAFKGGQLAGRIMGIIHDEYNGRKQEKSARFFALECINDQEVAHRLLQQAEAWARENGMNKIIGPFGFSDKDPEGVQVEGFDHLPVIATATNAAYLESLVVQEGYSKFVDCVVYRVPVPDTPPDNYFRIAERISNRNSLRSVSFTSRRSLKPYVIPVFRLINETYKDIYGFVPLSEAEMKKLEAQYLPILNPKFVKMVLDKHDRPVAFVIAVPDFSKGLQKARGRMFPFGFLKVFASMKKTKQLDLLLGAVLPELQGKGITTLLATELLRDVRENGFTHMDSHLILETNHRMRAEVERIGGAVYKRYRIYEKWL